MGTIVAVRNLSQFQQLISTAGTRLVVVDFTATWCGPCKMISPVFESLSQKYAGRALFLKVDVDDANDVAQFCSVSSMPTFHGYLNGSIVFQFSGADRNQLENEIEQHAPSSSQVSFAGAGNVLGGNAGAPIIEWDSAKTENISKPNPREAAAYAAARRLNVPSDADSDGKKNDSREGKESSSKSNSKQVDGDVQNEHGAASEAEDVNLNVNESLLSNLVEMGFPRIRALKALKATNSSSPEVAMDWCFEHADDPDIDDPLPDSQMSSNTQRAGVHTEKVSQNALSAEERQARASELLGKAREKRIAEEKAAEIEREKNRVRSGKDITAAKAAYEEQQRKILVEKRRKEKQDALEERRRIRERIAADREARRAKFNMPQSHTNEAPVPSASAVSSAVPANASSTPSQIASGKVQFRLPDGSRLERTFDANNTIGDAAVYIAQTKPDLASAGFKLSQQYPKRVFSQADMSMTLADAELFPRGALIVSTL